MTNLQQIKDVSKETPKMTGAARESNDIVKAVLNSEWLKNEVLESNLNLTKLDNTKVDVKVTDIIKAINSLIPSTSVLTSGQRGTKLQNSNLTLEDGTVIKTGQFNMRSENVAYLQLWLGVDADGFWWTWTSGAAASLGIAETRIENHVEKNINTGSISATIEAINRENFFDDFVKVHGKELALKYQNIYKIFNLRYGTLNDCTLDLSKTRYNISYTSEITNKQESISIYIPSMQNADKNINITKFMKEIKDKVEKKEFELENEALTKSVNEWVKNIEISKFSPLIQEYLKYQKFTKNNDTKLDFKPRYGVWSDVGMVVEGNILKVTYIDTNGVEKPITQLKLEDISTNKVFDPVKFVQTFTEKDLDNRSRRRKITMLTNDIKKKWDTLDGFRVPVVAMRESVEFTGAIKLARNLVKIIENFNASSNVDLDTNTLTAFKNKIEYTEANNSYAIRYRRFVDWLNKVFTMGDAAKMRKDYANVMDDLTVKQKYKTYFVAAGKEWEFDDYVEKFKLLAPNYI